MSVATYSLLAAIGWGLVSAVAVIASAARSRGGAPPDRSGHTPARIGVADLLAGAAVGGVGMVATMVVGTAVVQLGGFGVMSVIYLFTVVAAPLAMAVVLARVAWARRTATLSDGPRISRPALAVGGVTLLLAPIGFYATHVEPNLLDVERPPPLALAPDRAGSEPVSIGVLTDLQTPVVGDREREVVDQLMAAHPDVILLPGDVIQADPGGFDAQLPALHELFGRLSAPGGVYLVGGDVDQPTSRLPRMVEGTDVRYLDDEVVTTHVRDRTLTIGGVGLDDAAPAALAVVDELETAAGTDDVRILVAHRPDPVLALRPGSRIDLQVSGHTHGGQISVPFVGPLMTLTAVPRWVAAGGLHELDGHPIYVGHGVGLERGQAPQIRFLVRPNIGVLTIE